MPSQPETQSHAESEGAGASGIDGPLEPLAAPSRTRALAAVGATVLVLVLVRWAPAFASLGATGALFAWLAYVTVVTAGVPLLFLVVAMRVPLRELGLGWGRTRRDLPLLALGLLGAVALAFVLSRAPSIRAYYPHHRALVTREPWLWLPATLAFAAWGLAWEALFRGVLLLGTRATLGLASLVLQTALFATAHLDKPSLELALSVPAGLLFGLLALRTRSVLPGFVLHFALSTSLNVLCVYGPV